MHLAWYPKKSFAKADVLIMQSDVELQVASTEKRAFTYRNFFEWCNLIRRNSKVFYSVLIYT
ncbi:MAG: hypothetical protein ACRDL7_12375, partial [Gaiellaceae bacterium]